MNSARLISLLSLPLLAACGGSGGSANSADDVQCPPGQSYDGEFCQVDQNVATAEQPRPSEPAAEQPLKEEPATEDPAKDDATPKESAEENKPTEELPAEDEQPDTPAKASPVDVTMAAQAAPLIQYMAASHLPSGARQLGSPFAGQFAEGQILEKKVQLTSGKCYTVVAAALPPVAEVNVELFAEGAEEPAAKDDMAGLQAVLGSRTSCFKPSETGTYRLVLTVAKGQGIAAAQAFQK